MKIFRVSAVLLFAPLVRAAPPPLIVEEQSNPAGAGASAPVLARGENGEVWMAWAESGGLKCAEWRGPAAAADSSNRPDEKSAGGWGKVHTICVGPSAIDLPISLAVGEAGHLAATWLATEGTPMFTLSNDRGATWRPPQPVPRPPASDGVAAPSVGYLANGFALVVWLAPANGRTTLTAPGTCRLLTRFLDGPLAAAPDWQLAADADPHCAPKIVPLLDGGALVAYGSLSSASPAAVLRLLRLHGRRWRTLSPVAPGALRLNHHAEASIHIAADGGRVAAIWTASAGILVSLSPDAGGRFIMPAPIASGTTAVQPTLAILHDSAVIAVWRDRARIHLRRLAPDLSTDDDTPLDDAAARARPDCAPQIALLQDYVLGADSAEALVAFAAQPGGLHTVRVIVPETDLLSSAADACHCAPTGQQLIGYPLHGAVQSLDPAAGTVRIAIDAIPGVLDVGAYDFHAERSVLAKLRPGAACLARIDRIHGPAGGPAGWEIIDLHLLDTAR